eukprot:CAMPEP_0172048034 /NCGR_PEP_ID=MMETSP1043-20130122/1318_1 /TAXON_ID=464988 /ORGANISM="Hemiselmis andersenii, Strain CCMP441" /LENGTH=159 /DNA_ID=CAMNT_0012706911 /DNA_START=95 /DNA_END=571 /DNA_ORIENTATION=-
MVHTSCPASPAGPGRFSEEMRTSSSVLLTFIHDHLPVVPLLEEASDSVDFPDVNYPGQVYETGLEGLDDLMTISGVVPSILLGLDDEEGAMPLIEDEDQDDGEGEDGECSVTSLGDALSAREESACGSVRNDAVEMCEVFDDDLELPPGFSLGMGGASG